MGLFWDIITSFVSGESASLIHEKNKSEKAHEDRFNREHGIDNDEPSVNARGLKRNPSSD